MRTEIASDLWDMESMWRYICSVVVVDRRWNDFLEIVVDLKLKRVFRRGRKWKRKHFIFHMEEDWVGGPGVVVFQVKIRAGQEAEV